MWECNIKGDLWLDSIFLSTFSREEEPLLDSYCEAISFSKWSGATVQLPGGIVVGQELPSEDVLKNLL